MPTALHPQAKFDPISPDLDLHGLVERTANFTWVQRVSRAQIRNLGPQEFEKLVQIHVIAGGKPLVIDGWDAALPKWLFNVDWLEKTYDKKQENVRDISAATDVPMTTGHYLRSMKQLTNQWSPHTYRDERRQRLYLKDIDCPPEWRDSLQKVIHPSLFYLNENVNASSGAAQHPDDHLFRADATAAPAGDLMSSLPVGMRAENLMCYIGHEGTFTPAHREMCASLGQNIMVEASVDGAGEKAGSSIWFMTESKDREVVREYFLSMLGHDIEIEKHFAQVNAWKKAPFDVYIVEQRVGDFILIPPLAAHQVWNRGTRTIKVAWNRTTVETLDLALHEALPKARLVCRDEQYRNKAIIYFTLQKYYGELREMEENAETNQLGFMGISHEIVRNSPRARQLAGDFKRLLGLFTEVLVDETFAFKEKEVEFLPFDSFVTCSYCRSNIFNRFLTCKHCVRTLDNGDEDAYDVCMECYAMGRSCACLSGLQWCEQWAWSELVDRYETYRAMVIANDGYIDIQTSPPPFEVARLKSGKKTVAHICQEALRRRPWKDITKPDREKTPSDSEPGDGDERAKKKPKRKKKKGELRRCHVCCHPDYSYRVHQCTKPTCSEGYCYGVLYRAFDMMPQKVLEDENWQCPKCLGICSCGACRRSGNTKAYTPKSTLLGHDTRPIADDRSVEALVDFRIHNLSWLKAVGEEGRSKDSRRMQRLREQADSAKAQELTHHVEAEQATYDDSVVQSASQLDTAEMRADNGYGDQSDVGQRPPSFGDDGGSHGQAPGAEDAAILAENLAGALEDTNLGDEASSSYPDPSVFMRQRIGMGYYEPDDTPDKILFDPYQIPSADLMKPPESDIPEFVKKSIRAAKRKARRENEDPEFVVGRSHHRKPRLSQRPDLLDSMDPALFVSSEMQEASPSETRQAEEPRPLETQEPPRSNQERAPQRRQPMPVFDANEPILRHAKPKSSYVELEDADLEDVIEENLDQVVPPIEAQTNGDSGGAEVTDDSDSSIKRPLPQEALGRLTKASLTQPRKKIGRPPMSKSITADAEKTASSTLPAKSAEVKTVKRGRGRPRKSIGPVPTGTEAGVELADAGRLADELALQPIIEHGAEARRERTTRRRSGRPPAAGTALPVSPVEAEPESAMADSTPPFEPRPPPKRGRGRPRRSDISGQARSTKQEVTVNQKFMSMSERRALQGKSFRIGKRKPRGGAPVTVSRSMTPGDEDDVLSHIEVRQLSPYDNKGSELDRALGPSMSLSPPPPRAERRGFRVGGESIVVNKPTVVRLADADSEPSGEDTASKTSSSSSSVDSGDDGDIPSTKVGIGAYRGRGRPRGRRGFGGVRGAPRRRGRPRASY